MTAWQKLLRPMLTMMGLCIVAGVLIKVSELADWITVEGIRQEVQGYHAMNWLFLLCATTILMTFGFPRQVVAFVSGAIFGALLGTLYATAIAGVSCTVGLLLSRWFLHRHIHQRFPGFILRVAPLMAQKPFIFTLAIRLLPAGSNALTNFVAGVTDVKVRYFVSASILGYLPQMVIFALMGKGLRSANMWQMSVSLLLFILAAVLGIYLYRWYQREVRESHV